MMYASLQIRLIATFLNEFAMPATVHSFKLYASGKPFVNLGTCFGPPRPYISHSWLALKSVKWPGLRHLSISGLLGLLPCPSDTQQLESLR